MFRLSLVLVVFSTLTAATAHGQTLASADEYSQRGIARFEKNDLEGAISDFTKAVELKASNPEFCFYFRGLARYRLHRLDEAIADLTMAISIKQHQRFYDDRGSLLLKKGDLEAALADFNKAIEIAPQFAKAYGDRGIVRLMRGEDMEAELDFKKCFELDRSLETQVKAAASKIKAHSSLEYQPPSDVEVVKFNWSEAPARALSANPLPISVTSSAVSQTGTRVLNPAPQGSAGPDRGLDVGMPPGGAPEPAATAHSFIENRFTVLLKNTGDKTIVGVQWKYLFEPKDPAREPLAFIFTTKTNIAPSKEKTLSEQGSPATVRGQRVQMPTQKTRALFKERLVILQLEYADGTTWPVASSSGEPAKSPQPN